MTEAIGIKTTEETVTPEAQDQTLSQPASLTQTVLIGVYLVVLAALTIYGLMAFWPIMTATEQGNMTSPEARFLFWRFTLADEVRLLLVVILAGILGSLVHGIRSFFWYVGNRAFVRSWISMYLLLPFVGAALSLIFYFVLRGGLFSPQASVKYTSPFGFAAFSGLIGMFSNQAGQKLKEIAETLFLTKTPIQGADHIGEENG